MGHHGHLMEAFCGDGVQNAGNQTLAVQLRRQLVLPESGRVSSRHDYTADLQLIHNSVSITEKFYIVYPKTKKSATDRRKTKISNP